ncbi:MAG: glutamine--fructose-6-phosphate transaminase (isomerizing) [Firmicutes bacterium]|nr:glutamine--fructose-6-phosphate transaminase (isomerizing) [Bacillota bacterium]
MCGIIGYLGSRLAIPVLLEGLYAQEYRGYDSAGIATIEEGRLNIYKSTGKIAELDKKIGGQYGSATAGIGHTRWATHGKPSDINCHPHVDCRQKIALVHNGIIENYQEVKAALQDQGHHFLSDTDTEVLPHLLEQYYQGDLLAAMQEACGHVKGFYAMLALCLEEPRRIVAARLDNPLIIGIGQGEYYFASDMSALIDYTREMIILQNGDIADVSDQGVVIYNQGQKVERSVKHIDWDKEAAKKGGYPHFMLKEIHEQPKVLAQTMQGRLQEDCRRVDLNELALQKQDLQNIDQIAIVACGTAYHAGLIGKQVIEKLLRMPVMVELASEFIHNDPLIDQHTLGVVISQSGETMDTLAALRVFRENGAKVLAICNVVDSTIAREADQVLYTMAGPEIAVASTKAYSSQLMLLYMLAFHLAQILQRHSDEQLNVWLKAMYQLPQLAAALLAENEETIKTLAKTISDWQDAFFIGRGLDYAVAQEGALKLKEISYIHAEAYAAGELKHGTIALITPKVPVIALATQEPLLKMMVSNIVELKTRGAYVIALTRGAAPEVEHVADAVIHLPETDELLTPVLSVIPLQLLAYYAALYRDCDIDQPRNLAKSVTVP